MMTIREIRRSFQYECDVCGMAHLQDNYSSRPPGWARLILRRDATDYQGHPVADGSIERLLCPQCTDPLINAINDTCYKVREIKTK